MLVDCLQKRAGNEFIVGSLEETQCALEVNYTLPLHEINLSNRNNFQEFGTLKIPGVENLKDIHSPEVTLQKSSCPQELQEGHMLNNNQEPNTSILAIEFLRTEESIRTDDCQKFTPFKVGMCQVEESGSLRNDELQNLLVGAECKANQISDKLNKVNGYATSAEDTQRNQRTESKQRNDILAVDKIVTGSLVSQCNEWPSIMHGLSNQTDNLCDGAAAVNFPSQDQIVDSSTCKNSSSPIKNAEGIVQNISEEGSHMEAQTPEQDGPEALWVKWRGKWQTGIRCSRADYPLSTLKGKPTHERKKYFVVFFPNTRTYSWVDMLLVRSIDELPEPLAYGTHYSWMAFVKDLTFPRRYIMQKLAVSMLDISDQLHTEAVIESARKASSWKEFAKEASLCRDYFELGRMLLKLHKMILPDYVSSSWVEHSFDTWMHQCQNAQSAESIETLTEELVDSVLWSNVEELWEAPVQPELGPEWRTWKQEVMKLFSTSHPGTSGIFDKQSYEGPRNSGQHFSRKRPKLDIRRPCICVSEVGDKMPLDNTLKCGPRKYNSQGVEKCTDICGSFNMEVTRTGAPVVSRHMAGKHDDMALKGVNLINNFTSAINTSVDITGKGDLSNDSRNRDSPKYLRCLAFMEAKGRQCGRWAKDGDVYCCVHLGNHFVNKPSQAELTLSTSMSQSTSMTVSSRIDLANERQDKDSPNKYLQCSAFMEAKGRRCGRWANDGDIYCCVHLSNHSMIKPALLELTPALETFMCEGTTIHGMKCKHRARLGSAFCKKHELHRTNDLVVAGNLLTYSGVKVKGKHGVEATPETIATTNVSYGNALLTGKTTSLMQDNLVSVAVVETSDERNLLRNNLKLNDALSTPAQVGTSESPRCIGFSLLNDGQCPENARKHNLYCEKHVPNFLKRARNGKSRLISKEIFINLLKSCTSRKEKIHLHQACELLYGFMKGSLSYQKLVSQGDLMGRLLSEACKDKNVGEYLLKLVSSEREKIGSVYGFEELKDKQVSFSGMNTTVPVLEAPEQNPRSPNSAIRCKICTEGFSDDKTLSIHWLEVHKKEAQWLFRGYACAVCMASFTNRKVQEAHVKEKHGMQFLEGSLLFRCMSCNSHFTNPSELWQHVISAHSMEFRLPDSDNLSKDNGTLKIELHNESCLSNGTTEKDDDHRRFVCRFCGLKFDLLPDLGRHHQSAHSNLTYASHLPLRANKHLKHSRLRHSRFKKGLGATSRFKKSTNFGIKNCFQSSSSVVSSRMRLHRQASQTSCLGRLLESHCFNVAETLFAEVKQTKSRPSNMEILSIARTTCCRTHLLDVLQEKHGILPENLYLKAAKLCSELNIQVNWHVDGFICPNGCRPHSQHSLSPLAPILSEFVAPAISTSDRVNNGIGEVDESHCVLNLEHFNWRPIRRTIILCEDMSFGQEPVPVACVIDKNIKDLFHMDFSEASAGQDSSVSIPWQGFTYVTKRLLNPSLGLDANSSQLGCACSDVKCCPETCDHVYLFDNDYENAKDIHGNSMHGRFPYDETGRIIVEEGCLVYECNSLCSCDKSCQNRVLQKGVQVKLEVFRTEKKGWAVRAAEVIPRGTFVCEYIGEVLNDAEASQRGERYDSEGCSYLYDIDAHIDADEHLSEGRVPYVIDATKYGNVSRFINHSCSPNLVNYQVLVESMDCQLAHIGLYANRDIAGGEELAYDYRYNLLPGTGCPCHCGSSNCRGRLY